MTPSDASSYFYLTSRPLAHLGDFYAREDAESETPAKLKDIHDLVREGSADSEITDNQVFNITLSSRQYSEAVCKRTYFSGMRIAKLCGAVKALHDVDAAPGWTLTTSYYSGFFAALEILFLAGRFVTYIDEDVALAVKTYSPTTTFTLSKGTFECESVWNAKDDTVTVFFAHGSDKPHQFTWDRLKQYVDGINTIPTRSLPQWELLRRILGGGKDRWRFPSQTRNIWNYTDSQRFAIDRDRYSSEFRNHCCDGSAAVRWVNRKPLVGNEQNYATAIAYLKAVLVAAFLELGRSVLPPKRFREIEKLCLAS